MNRFVWRRVAFACCALIVTKGAAAETKREAPILDVVCTIEPREGTDSADGSLFEVYDDHRNVVAGAGIAGSQLFFYHGLSPLNGGDAGRRFAIKLDALRGPIKLRFELTADQLSLWQEGELAKQVSHPRQEVSPDRIVWGRGRYGPFDGQIVARESNLDRPFLGAYVKFGQVFAEADTIAARKSKIDVMLDQFRDSGLQVLMPYVTTTSGSAAFPSRIVKTHLYKGWDPLAYLITGAKRRRLQVYPVFCVLACGHESPAGILKTHPEWAIRSPEGRPIGFISPAHPAARDWVTSVIDEIVGGYDIDGVLLDYLRFHNRPIRLDAASEADFESYRRQVPDRSDSDAFQSFREASLTALARQISESVRATRPDLRIAIYSWGPHVTKNHRVSQRWPTWSREGYIDMVNISGYCYPENYGEGYLDVFSRRIGDAIRLNRIHHGRADVTFCLGVVTSHGKINQADQINDYLVRGIEQDVAGVAVFTWSTLGTFLDQTKRSGHLKQFADTQRRRPRPRKSLAK